MKKINRFEPIDLYVDVVGYMFIEWLVRQGLYSAFLNNYRCASSNNGSFRQFLRDVLYFVVTGESFYLGTIFTAFFPFKNTPEGAAFWMKHSSAWRLFCENFQNKL